MGQGRTSLRADALRNELHRSIQEGYKTSTGTEQAFFGQQLDEVDELDEARELVCSTCASACLLSYGSPLWA
jgi:hypothetical protein